MKKLIVFLLIILVVGGVKPFFQAIVVLEDTAVGAFPLVQIGIKEYISSPYFIVGAIMVVASVFGIIIGKKQGQELYIIVSIISTIIGVINMGIPLF